MFLACRQLKVFLWHRRSPEIEQFWVNSPRNLMSKRTQCHLLMGFPGGSDGKESACNVGDPGSVPGLGRSPGARNGNPLNCSYQENAMDRRTWLVGVHAFTKQRVEHD